MRVEVLDREMVDSDLGVVNAARCSFEKASALHRMHWVTQEQECYNRHDCPEDHYHYEMDSADVRLIRYLANHEHWTPFAHAQEVFQFDIDNMSLLQFFSEANLAGFEWLPIDHARCNIDCVSTVTLRGSLYSWLTNVCFLPVALSRTIQVHLYARYPVSTRELKGAPIDMGSGRCVVSLPEGQCVGHDEVMPVTLRISCPIAIKRQLETHRRNLVMTDIVDMVQNEVSRRYVDTPPEFYIPEKWRVQSKSRKQGSDAHLTVSELDSLLCEMDYTRILYFASTYYTAFNKRGVAHEQSRFMLPLSTYTTFWWTGSMKSWRRVFDLRLRDDVQSETRELVQMMADAVLAPLAVS